MAVAASIDVLLRANTRKFDGALTRSTALVKGFGVAAAAIGGTAFFDKAIRSTADFHRAMAKSTAIMGDLSKELRQGLVKGARDVARATKFSATEASEAYFFLASAGLDAKQSIAALPQVSKFAQAGMFDLSRATDLLTDAQSALGLTTKTAAANLANMSRVSDVLVKANTLANASVEQFSEALTTKAGAALRILGKDIEEGVAVLAAFADQGVKGSEAGTALSIVLRELSTKAIKNARNFSALGISVFDAANEMRNLGDIIADLEGVLTGMSDRQKKATLLMLGFTDKSVSFIQSVVGMSDKIRQYEKDLRRLNNTTEEIANKTLPDFDKALNKVTADLTESRDSAVTPMLTALGDFGEMVSNSLGPGTLTRFNMITLQAQLLGKVLKDVREAQSKFAQQTERVVVRAEQKMDKATRLHIQTQIRAAEQARMRRVAWMQHEAAMRKATAKRLKEMKERGAELREQLKTDAERIQEEWRELVRLFRAGAISLETFKRGRDRLRERFEEPMKRRREELARKRDRMKEEGEFIRREFRTPAEEFRERIAELERLRKKGFIDKETFRRAAAAAGKNLREALASDKGRFGGVAATAALERGTQAAFASFQQARRDAQRADDDVAELKKLNAEVKRLRREGVVLGRAKL